MLKTDELRDLVIDALEELKATDIRELDVSRLTDVTDRMVVASGGSDRQVKAIARNVIERAKEHGHPPLGVEGEREGEWILVDLYDIVVHVMLPRIRDFYQIEKLWSGEPEAAGAAKTGH